MKNKTKIENRTSILEEYFGLMSDIEIAMKPGLKKWICRNGVSIIVGVLLGQLIMLLMRL